MLFAWVLIFAIWILVFRWLWNTTMPQVFGVKPVPFWQAVRLLLLTWFLFGVIDRGPSVQSLESALTELRSRVDAMKPKAEPAKTDLDDVLAPPAAKPEAAPDEEPAKTDRGDVFAPPDAKPKAAKPAADPRAKPAAADPFG